MNPFLIDPLVTTRTSPQLCPGCGYSFDAHSSLTGGHLPTEGDFTVCLACAIVLRYGPNLRVRKATDEEIDREGDRAELDKVVSGIKYLRERNASWPKGAS